MASGDYESHFTKVFLDCLPAHDAVLDIGANIGFYTCLAAVHGKHVIAFEPSSRNLAFLYDNLWSDGFLDEEVFPVGLGRARGLMPIYGFGGISSFVRDWAQASRSRFSIVPITTLDTIVAGRLQGSKLLIKIDVEGFEADVLAGAKAMLALDPKPTWMVEIFLRYEAIPGGVNTRFCETFEFFWDHGYACRRLNASQLSVSQDDVKRWAADGVVETGVSNFLFVAKEQS
jgi:FkbM family methyltransferase